MRLFEAKDPFELFEGYEEEDEQTRIATGAAAQKVVVKDFQKKFPASELTYQAPPGSQKTDIIMTTRDGTPVHFEVKVHGARITAYDSSLRRGDTDPLLDWAVSTLQSNKEKLTFTQLVDRMRTQNKKYGFPGDEGVAKSGGVPALRLSGPAVLSELRKQLIKRYLERKDNYLALVDPTTSHVAYCYIQGPFLRALHPQKFPKIRAAVFDSYGYDFKSKDKLRAAIKVFLEP